MFNIQQLFHHKSKHYETNSMHPYSTKAFQTHQKCNKRHCGLGDLNVTNKQNKQITFLHICMTICSYSLCHAPFDGTSSLFCFFIGWRSFSSKCMLRFDFQFFNISLFSLFVLFVIWFFFLMCLFVCLSKRVCVLCFWCLCLFVCDRSCVYFKFFGLRM